MVTTPDDLAEIADRLASLADTAELMGDEDSAARLREDAALVRLRGMDLLET